MLERIFWLAIFKKFFKTLININSLPSLLSYSTLAREPFSISKNANAWLKNLSPPKNEGKKISVIEPPKKLSAGFFFPASKRHQPIQNFLIFELIASIIFFSLSLKPLLEQIAKIDL